MALAAQVDEDVRQARRDELVSLQQGVGRAFAEALAGREARPPCAGARSMSRVQTQRTSPAPSPARGWALAGPREQGWACVAARFRRGGPAGGCARGRLQ